MAGAVEHICITGISGDGRQVLRAGVMACGTSIDCFQTVTLIGQWKGSVERTSRQHVQVIPCLWLEGQIPSRRYLAPCLKPCKLTWDQLDTLYLPLVRLKTFPELSLPWCWCNIGTFSIIFCEIEKDKSSLFLVQDSPDHSFLQTPLVNFL